MKLLGSTDHGVRILIYLAWSKLPISPMSLIAADLSLNIQSIRKPLEALTKAGILDAFTGRSGGYCFKRDPAGVGLGEVCKLLETDFILVPVMEMTKQGQFEHPNCSYRFSMELAKNAFLATLDNTTIGQLASNPETLRAIDLPECFVNLKKRPDTSIQFTEH